nr:hypothetical protein [Tanacetum cinerariifolium]
MNSSESSGRAYDPLGGSGQGKNTHRVQFKKEPPIYTASAPRVDDPYIMVRDAAMAPREDDDDDISAPRDP